MENKEKEIELKVKADKVSKEHLDELQNVVNEVNRVHMQIGQIEGQKQGFINKLKEIQDKIASLQRLLKEQYGSDDVNIVDGTINWPKEEKDEK